MAGEACITGFLGETEDHLVNITCAALTAPTVTSPVTICSGQTAALIASTSTGTLKWYTTLSGGSPIATGSPFTTPSLITNTSYYVATETPGCSSTRSQIQVNVQPSPTVNLGPDIAQCSGTVLLDAGNPGLTFLWSSGPSTQTIIVSASGNYQVTVTNGIGCGNSDSINVEIESPPIAGTASSAALNVCEGASTYLEVTGSVGDVIWYYLNGSSWESVGTGTSYTTPALTLVAAPYQYKAIVNGDICDADTSNVIEIEQPSNAGVASSADLSVCEGASTNLEITASIGDINWYYLNGSTWDVVGTGTSYATPALTSVSAPYEYKAIATGVCDSDTSNIVAISVDVCGGIGINDLGFQRFNVKISPNPNNGIFTLLLNQEAGTINIQVVNLYGKLMKEFSNAPNSNKEMQFDLSDFSSGVYYLKINTNASQDIQKLVVQK